MGTDNIASLAAARSAKAQKPDGPSKDDGRPVIKWEAGELPKIVDAAEQTLLKSQEGVYRQGKRLIRVIWDTIKIAGGGDGHVLRLSQITTPYLTERFTAIAQWEKWIAHGRDGAWEVCNCPPVVAETYLARDGSWKVPFILGVVTTPIMRPDGTIISKPGYDEETGILFNPLGATYPEIPDRPTKEDAKKALEFLKGPLKEFEFIGAGRSVALSAIITAVVRRALPTAPMHAFSAPTAGSGKSLLVNIASVIATGESAAVLSAGDPRFGMAELEKRITAALLAGDLVLSIDNVESVLGGEMLCQAISEPMLKLRILGRSDRFDTPNTACFFATGNNLTLLGDMTRRALIGVLDIHVDRPELRRFKFHPIAMVRAARGEYVKAVLTIVRAYVVSGEKIEAPQFGTFEKWAQLVRDPLVWLGELDPISVVEDVRRDDPRLTQLTQMINAWDEVFGLVPQTIHDVLVKATDTNYENGGFAHPNFHDIISTIGTRDGKLSAERVAGWFRKNVGRMVRGFRFERVIDDTAKYVQWQLTNHPQALNSKGSIEDEDLPF